MDNSQLLDIAKQALVKWLSELSYGVSQRISHNYYTAESNANGKIALILINRKTYQSSVNCVYRWKFNEDLMKAKALGCHNLYYVMYLHENRAQIIVSQNMAIKYFTQTHYRHYSISMERTAFGEDYDYDHCVVFRPI